MTPPRSLWPARWVRAGLLAWLLATAGAARPADKPFADEPGGLRVVRSAHYSIHTDIADHALVDDIAHRMDVMYGLYAEQLSEFRPSADAPPLTVYLFAERKRYIAFTRAAGANTAGLFVGGKRSFLTSFLGGQGRDALRRTLQHEAFHQFAYFTVSKRLPIWLNEGLAQVFEEGIWTGKSFLLGQIPPRRVRQLRSDVDHGKLVPFDQFLTITPKAWSDVLHRDADRGATYYNEAWAVAQFLTRGNSADYTKRGGDFLRRLHALELDADADEAPTGEDAAGVPGAFSACFPNVPALQKAFEGWAQNMRATDEAVLIERQETLGDFLIALKENGRTFNNVAAFRSAAILLRLRLGYTRGAVKYRTNPDPRTYFADLNGAIYPPQQLLFVPSPGSPLPDILCRPAPGFNVRTHFYVGDAGKAEHEVAIEPAGR